jgi:hypothetical protein
MTVRPDLAMNALQDAGVPAGTARLPTSGIAISIAPMRSMVHRIAPTIAKARWPSMTICVAESIVVGLLSR